MKEKIHFVIEAGLAIAIIILFVLFFSGGKRSSDEKIVVSEEGKVLDRLPMAFIDIDSLLTNYTYSLDINERLMKKMESSNANLTAQMRRFESEVNSYQQKVETGAFLSRERQMAEEERLMKRRQELQQLDAKLQQEFNDEQVRYNIELQKTLLAQLQAYNKDKGYQFIFGKMGENILLADPSYNITAEVIEYLNRAYAVSPLKLD